MYPRLNAIVFSFRSSMYLDCRHGRLKNCGGYIKSWMHSLSSYKVGQMWLAFLDHAPVANTRMSIFMEQVHELEIKVLL